MLLFGLFLLSLSLFVNASQKRPVVFSYPIHYLVDIPEHGIAVSQDELTCFESKPSSSSKRNFFNSFLCLFPFYPTSNCYEIWGSRSLLIRVIGEVEFIIPQGLPKGISSNHTKDVIGIRLIELGDGNHEHMHGQGIAIIQSLSPFSSYPHHQKEQFLQEILQSPSEPITMCARSLLSERNSTFFITFKNSFIREKDRRSFLEHFLYHILMLLTISSIWLLPYLIAFIVFVLAFLHAMKKLLVLLVSATAIVALTPFMFTKRNRQLALLYFSYFFRSSTLAEDSKLFLRQQRPLFQAFYFSAILLTFGTAASYLLYHYFGVDREYRNFLLRVTFAVSLSWCAFFIARSFDKFFRDWGWIVLSITSINMIKDRINPHARNEITVICLILSLLLVIASQNLIIYALQVLHFHPFRSFRRRITSSRWKKSSSNLDLKMQ